jgi:glycosyltransferase involved in cell wall biosynthesis
MTRPLRILTWNVHGGYLASLAHIGHTIYLPVRKDPRDGYGGRPQEPGLPPTLVEVSARRVPDLDIDVVLYQSPRHYLQDRHTLLGEHQRRLPAVYLEHDPPRGHPTDTRHLVQDEAVLLVHCTRFNALMWDSGRTKVRVIEHGVPETPGVRYQGDLERAVAVINDLPTRGRRLGSDVFEAVRSSVPVDLLGLRSESVGGLGPVAHDELPARVARYRCYLNPIRYTSLGLAMIEAMLAGVPVVGLATTELPSVFTHGETGLLAMDAAGLAAGVRQLLDDPALARRIGAAGRELARQRFGVERFARDWTAVLEEAVALGAAEHAPRNRRRRLRALGAGSSDGALDGTAFAGRVR